MKTINTISLLRVADSGSWLGVDNMINEHLNLTNWNVEVDSILYNKFESDNQWEYDNQLFNAMGLSGQDTPLKTQKEKYDYLKFKIEQANCFVK